MNGSTSLIVLFHYAMRAHNALQCKLKDLRMRTARINHKYFTQLLCDAHKVE